jgi:hypothetical protein
MKLHLAANRFKVFAGAIFFGCITGCSVIDPGEDIPSYVHINAMSVNAIGGSSGQGSSSSKITDAWVYMDGQLVGAFEMPCTFPVLAEGNHHFLVRAGVKMNGTGSTRAIYPFYRGWEGDLTLTRGQVKQLAPDPVVDYFPGNFPAVWMEDFGSSGISINSESSYNGVILRDTISNNPYALEGGFGYVYLNSSDTMDWVGRSSSIFSLNATGEVWLELNYKCNEEFTVGIIGYTNDYHSWVVVEPSENWNKIYIRLTDVIATTLSTSPYRIYFAMHQTNVARPYLFLDNIKLIK